MSLINVMVNLGFTMGIPTAVIATVKLISNLFTNKDIMKPLIITVAGVLFSIPLILCEFYGEEIVETYDTSIYEKDGEYINIGSDGITYVLVEKGNTSTKIAVEPSTIKVIEDSSTPRLQTVTTYKKFSIFETSKQTYIIWVPEIK